LGGEDLGILEQQILALHARTARPRADQHGDLAVLEGDARIVGRRYFVEREERAIVQLHHDALHGAERGRNLEQIEIDGLIGTEHLPGGDAKGECIPDVSGCAGDGDGNWLFHGGNPRRRNAQKRQIVAEDPARGPRTGGRKKT
jgi:hypothetical protein